jgi:hypothetical protein
MTTRDAHSSSAEPSLVTQVEAMIDSWRMNASSWFGLGQHVRAEVLNNCADQLQPLLVLLVEQQQLIAGLADAVHGRVRSLESIDAEHLAERVEQPQKTEQEKP